METKKTTDLKNSFSQARANSLRKWGGITHRLEWLGETGGVDFVNDSKATDLESVYYSLETIDKPIVWICGNVTEEQNFWAIEKLVKYKVKAIHAFGDNLLWKPEFRKWVDVFNTHSTLSEAFTSALGNCAEESVVLMSPGNSSFDQYKNFKERGDVFRKLVMAHLNG